MELPHTVALVTGAAKRVGRAIALELAKGGCDVGVHFQSSSQEAMETAEEIRALGRRSAVIRGDLNEPSEWSRIVKQCADSLGRLDILVNNASIFHADGRDTLEQLDPFLWDRSLRVNLTAAAGLIHHATPYLSSHETAHVINLTDATVDRPFAEHLAYSASKAGLVALTKALARRLAPRIRVNAVAPGIAVFPESYGMSLREKLVDRVPLKRAGTPEDIARVVRFLVENGDYITGAVIPVDGGRGVV